MVTQDQANRIAALANVSERESAARLLMAEARVLRDDDTFETIVLNVFAAQWAYSLPIAQITAIASALSNVHLREEVIAEAVTRLVRGKVLRSRRSSNGRTWELAL